MPPVEGIDRPTNKPKGTEGSTSSGEVKAAVGKPHKAKPKFTPAKIVRKAEVRKPAGAVSSQSSSPGSRSPDRARGTSPLYRTGGGSGRPTSGGDDRRGSAAGSASQSAADPAWTDDARGKKDNKRRIGAPSSVSGGGGTEKEDGANRKLQRVKRDQVSTRLLLEQLDYQDEDVSTPVKTGRKKTVYTPTASSRKRDLKRRKDLKKTQITTPRASYRVVKMGQEITIGELARQLCAKAGDLIKKLMSQGVMATINQTVDFDTASLIAADYKYEVQSNLVSIDDILQDSQEARESAQRQERPPIVTIMGHVDHGKTSILDAIRKADVATSEAGGITQHIGAYTVEKDGKVIAFLDTPGHEAFSAMRARGARVTDIVILVVAADDGVMPQTVEAISHARNAKVPLIVAINKMDKPNINVEKVFNELMEHGVQSEEWGGDTQFVKVSAENGTGIDELLEAINLQAEILELSAPIDAPAEGVVVEAHLDKGRGAVATVMVCEGTLKIGAHVVVGTTIGKLRAMQNHLGEKLESAGPSTPVEIIGLSGVPMAGDKVSVVVDERKAKEVAMWRSQQLLKRTERTGDSSMDELLGKMAQQDKPEVAVVVKADTQGSVEAIVEAISKLDFDKVSNRIVHKAVGGVNESDISLAAAANAMIVGFNVRASRGLDEIASNAGVPISYFSVIYDVVDAITNVMAGKLPPTLKEVVVGHAEVRQTIRVPKIGLVAGSSVMDGKITRNSSVRLIRDQVVIFNGRIASLRRFKDDVKEVAQGYECGIGIDGYSDIKIGDVIETYVLEEHSPVLQ